jgi:feruloyl-CoA synthase
MGVAGTPPPRFADPSVDVERRDGGVVILRSPVPLGDYPAQLGVHLRHWAAAAPDRLFVAERDGENWQGVTYAEARRRVDAISQWLLDRGLNADRPVMILSGNSVKHALLTLAAMQVGIPVAPSSPAYSLMSRDFTKVRHIFDLVRPGLIYVEDGAPFAAALSALDLDGVVIVSGGKPPGGLEVVQFEDMLSAAPGGAVETAFAAVTPDSVAKYLFTSGSTGMPKGVINTQRMLCANRQQNLQIWPFLMDEPPVMVDWLPWNHTFGANANFNQVLVSGGTMYIDAGRPVAGLIEETVRNLREIAPTHYATVPAGIGMLLPHLERDRELRENFFSRLKLVFYAGSALPADLWRRLEAVSAQSGGEPVLLVTAWGSTETAPLATGVHWGIREPGVIGLPVPETEIKMVPNGGKMELRVRGPNVTPGYLNRPHLTAEAFDEEGYYRIGDAGRFADADDPAKGIVFDGRVVEDFKLTSGTFVHVGSLRIAALAAATPLLQDAVVAGHDREFVALLAWPNLEGCRSVADAADAGLADLIRNKEVLAHLRAGLAAYNADHPGGSTRIARLLLLDEPPDIDANEITDKGYINQRAVLENRAGLVSRLYADDPDADVIVL